MKPCRSCGCHGGHYAACPQGPPAAKPWAERQRADRCGPPAQPEPARHQGRILGFRTWHLAGHQLRSFNSSIAATWLIGSNTARCYRSRFAAGWQFGVDGPGLVGADTDHAAPAPGCSCGLYAYHAPPPIDTTAIEPEVVGAILGWGRVEVHPNGWRAEHAEPVMLAFDEDQPYGHVRAVQAIAEEFGITTVDLNDLEDLARARWSPVPKELRPQADPAEISMRLGGGFVSFAKAMGHMQFSLHNVFRSHTLRSHARLMQLTTSGSVRAAPAGTGEVFSAAKISAPSPGDGVLLEEAGGFLPGSFDRTARDHSFALWTPP